MKSRKSTKSKAAAILAASILVAMTIAGCDNPQRNELRPEWEEELLSAMKKSAKSEHDLYELVKKYKEEHFSLLRQMMYMQQDRQYISHEETKEKYERSFVKLSVAAREFLVQYPHSQYYSSVQVIYWGAWELMGYDAEEIEQEAREIRREQRER